MNKSRLEKILASDDLGLLDVKAKAKNAPQDLLVRGFLDIVDFVEVNGRPPLSEATDVVESQLFWRLQSIRGNEEQLARLRIYDTVGVLAESEPPSSLNEVLDDDPLGLLSNQAADIFELRNLPKKQEMPDQIAQRKPCKDFEQFEDLFVLCQKELKLGARKQVKFRKPSQIKADRFYVLNGVLLYVAFVGPLSANEIGKTNGRLRCIFENGTESDMLLQSLASNLYKDGKLVTEPDSKTLKEMELEPQTRMGYLYILETLSDDPQLAPFKDLHKIGFTRRDPAARQKDQHGLTFLNAPTKVVASYKVPEAIAARVETLLHRVFQEVRLDATSEINGITTGESHEWFDAPRDVIDEAIQLIQAETIMNYKYDVDNRLLILK